MIREETRSFWVASRKVFAMPSSIAFPLCLVVCQCIIVHSYRPKLSMCAVLELSNPLMFAVICPIEFHCIIGGKNGNEILNPYSKHKNAECS